MGSREIDDDIDIGKALFGKSSSFVVFRFHKDIYPVPAFNRHLAYERASLSNSQQKDFHAFK
jgi:hypothetical protein